MNIVSAYFIYYKILIIPKSSSKSSGGAVWFHISCSVTEGKFRKRRLLFSVYFHSWICFFRLNIAPPGMHEFNGLTTYLHLTLPNFTSSIILLTGQQTKWCLETFWAFLPAYKEYTHKISSQSCHYFSVEKIRHERKLDGT